jgi:lipid-binding SYLF domain-containing protein
MPRILSVTLLVFMFCNPAFADKADSKRAKIQKMRAEVLEQLHQEKPSIRSEIKNAAGYAVFTNIGVNVIFVSAGGGSGVVHDNRSGKDTYMKMGSAGVGLGFGVKDFRGIFVFHTPDALKSFIDSGWDFSGQADAAAKSGDKGAEGNVSGTVVNGVSLYQLTETGLALQATLQGTKYWLDKKLN